MNRNYKVSILDSLISNTPKKHDPSDGTIYSDNAERFRRIIVDKLDNNILYFSEQIKERNYYVKDQIPEINWNTNFKETKKIGKYLCKKATTNFRGSLITVYYTLEIPVSIGPFKLKGLPGLILEAYSENALNKNYWIAKKITYPYSGQIPINPTYLSSLKLLTIKDFVRLKEKNTIEFEQKITSKLPPGAVPVGSVKTRPGLEQVYEWE